MIEESEFEENKEHIQQMSEEDAENLMLKLNNADFLQIVRQTIEHQKKEEEPPQAFIQLLEDFSQQDFKMLSKAVNQAKSYHYPRSRDRKYGNLRRYLKLDELKRFFDVVENADVARAFLIQLFYGLRISELSKIEVSDDGKTLKVDSSKSESNHFIPIHGESETLLDSLERIRDFSAGYLRKCFRNIREQAGLDETYGESSDGRNLYQFTSHSLRHTAIQTLAEVESDDYTVTKFSRHKSEKQLGVVATYRFEEDKKLRNVLEEAFSDHYELIRLGLNDTEELDDTRRREKLHQRLKHLQTPLTSTEVYNLTGWKRSKRLLIRRLRELHRIGAIDLEETRPLTVSNISWANSYEFEGRITIRQDVKSSPDHNNSSDEIDKQTDKTRILRNISSLDLPIRIGKAYAETKYEPSYKTFQRRIRELAEEGKLQTERKMGSGGNTTLIKSVKQ